MAAIALNDLRLKRLRIMVPERGPWIAEAQLDEAAELPVGAATLQAGAVALQGTIALEASGAYLVSTRARVIGGAGGWRNVIIGRHYHNDAGVSIANVLSTTAAAVGETLGDVSGLGRLLAVDYERIEGRASAVLDRLAPDWWVDFDGVTQVAARPSSDAAAPVEVEAFDTISHVAELRVAEITDLTIGSRVTGRFAAPLTVRALEFDFGDVLKVGAWLE